MREAESREQGAGSGAHGAWRMTHGAWRMEQGARSGARRAERWAHGAWGACKPGSTSGRSPSRFALAAFVLHVLFVLSLTPASAQFQRPKGISVGEPPADHSPEAELRSFKVLDGFAVNLFASEADGAPNPLVLRWDERGRLWVLCTVAYPQPAPGEPTDDRVLILEDTDRDGRMDKKTVFAGGLRMPMGMELAGPGELYLGEGEKLLLLRDTNGDDRADVRETVLSGFGTGDTHQNINSFIWSPDGALVMHQGLHCYSRVATPWGVRQLYGAGFWRFWPRSRKLEAYPTGMPQNPWGTAFTDDGQPIMVAGAAGMFWARPMEISAPEIAGSSEHLPYFLLTRFMLPSGGQIIKTDELRKFCGVDIAGSSRWPAAMQGEIVTGGFFNNAVYRHKLIDDKDNPSGFEATEQPALITSENVAFRPVDVRFGPEGALYIADWYDPIIGHYQASFRHPNRDSARGRIWRVVAEGREKPDPQLAKLATQDVAQLLDVLEDKDRWSQYQAQRLLLHLDKSAVLNHPRVAGESGVLSGHGKDGLRSTTSAWRMRMGFEAHDEGAILRQLASGQASLRREAARSIAECSQSLSEPDRCLAGLIGDDDPRVRLEAIVAMAKVMQASGTEAKDGQASGLSRLKLLLTVLDKPMDSFLDRALWLAIHATAPQWKRSVVPPSGGSGGSLLESLPPKHLAYLIEKDGSDEILGVARKLLAERGGSLSDDLKRALTVALVRKGQPGDMLAALQLGLKSQAVLDDLAEAASQRGYRAPQGALPLLSQLLGSGGSEQQAAAIKLAAAWRMKELAAAVAKFAAPASGGTASRVRIAALEALGRLGGDPALIRGTASDVAAPVAVRLAALKSLVDLDPAAAGESAAAGLAAVTDAELMRQWLAPLLPREAATQALTAALKARPCPADAARLALQALTAAGRSDAGLTAALNSILGVKNTVPAYDPAWVGALAAEVKTGGDAARGKAVFNTSLANCKTCHRIAKEGGAIGPELDQVGRGVPIELLIEAVVWPNRQIKEGYVATTLATKDGRQLQGYKVSDAGGELQLRDFLSATVHRIPLGEITQKQEAGSLMPEGLIAMMTREELRDLIAFLTGLGR